MTKQKAKMHLPRTTKVCLLVGFAGVFLVGCKSMSRIDPPDPGDPLFVRSSLTFPGLEISVPFGEATAKLRFGSTWEFELRHPTYSFVQGDVNERALQEQEKP